MRWQSAEMQSVQTCANAESIPNGAVRLPQVLNLSSLDRAAVFPGFRNLADETFKFISRTRKFFLSRR